VNTERVEMEERSAPRREKGPLLETKKDIYSRSYSIKSDGRNEIALGAEMDKAKSKSVAGRQSIVLCSRGSASEQPIQ